MKCTDKCYSPTACEGFGYCRNRNKPFEVTRLVSPSNVEIQLGLKQAGFATIEISARTLKAAEKMADDHPEWFWDNNAVKTFAPLDNQ